MGFVSISLLPYGGELSNFSDGNDRSVLVVKAYQKRRIGRDKFVGKLTDTIGEVLRKSKDGGMESICLMYSIEAISTIQVVEETLEISASDGFDLGITIKFSFSVVAEPSKNVSAAELQAAHAVDKATEMVNRLGSTPQAVDLMSSGVDAGSSFVTQAQKANSTLGILLQRMALFNKIVADVVAVFVTHPLDYSTSEYETIDPPVCVARLVCYIGCDPGLSVHRSLSVASLIAIDGPHSYS